MITFDEKFFEAEVRDDFRISPMMKRCWAAEMEVLCQIDRICKKHGIPYFADWGTLLGAVRHKGIIPWDDEQWCKKTDKATKYGRRGPNGGHTLIITSPAIRMKKCRMTMH